MRINKCDICKKEIKFAEYINVRFEYDHYELCNECSEPIFKFLEKKKLIKKEKNIN